MLERLEPGGFPVPFTSIFSYHDNLVASQTSSIHSSARNVPVAGIGHVSLVFSRQVHELVAAELDAANAKPSGSDEPPALSGGRS